jgi:hypothetical protein
MALKSNFDPFFPQTYTKLILLEKRNIYHKTSSLWQVVKKSPRGLFGIFFSCIVKINPFLHLYYRIVASRSTSRLVTCLGLFRLLMMGIFGPYVLWPLDKKLIFWIVTLLVLATIRYTKLIKKLSLFTNFWKISLEITNFLTYLDCPHYVWIR